MADIAKFNAKRAALKKQTDEAFETLKQMRKSNAGASAKQVAAAATAVSAITLQDGNRTRRVTQEEGASTRAAIDANTLLLAELARRLLPSDVYADVKQNVEEKVAEKKAAAASAKGSVRALKGAGREGNH